MDSAKLFSGYDPGFSLKKYNNYKEIPVILTHFQAASYCVNDDAIGLIATDYHKQKLTLFSAIKNEFQNYFVAGGYVHVVTKTPRLNDFAHATVPGAFFKGTINPDSAVGGKSLRDVSYGLSNDYDDVTSNVLLARFEQTLSPDLELSTQLRGRIQIAMPSSPYRPVTLRPRNR